MAAKFNIGKRLQVTLWPMLWWGPADNGQYFFMSFFSFLLATGDSWHFTRARVWVLDSLSFFFWFVSRDRTKTSRCMKMVKIFDSRIARGRSCFRAVEVLWEGFCGGIFSAIVGQFFSMCLYRCNQVWLVLIHRIRRFKGAIHSIYS